MQGINGNGISNGMVRPGPNNNGFGLHQPNQRNGHLGEGPAVRVSSPMRPMNQPHPSMTLPHSGMPAQVPHGSGFSPNHHFHNLPNGFPNQQQQSHPGQHVQGSLTTQQMEMKQQMEIKRAFQANPGMNGAHFNGLNGIPNQPNGNVNITNGTSIALTLPQGRRWAQPRPANGDGNVNGHGGPPGMQMNAQTGGTMGSPHHLGGMSGRNSRAINGMPAGRSSPNGINISSYLSPTASLNNSQHASPPLAHMSPPMPHSNQSSPALSHAQSIPQGGYGR